MNRFTRESYQPFRMTAQITVKPMIDPPTPKGERKGRLRISSAFARRRKETCAARETTQDRIIPKNAARKMNSNAFRGAHFSRANANRNPYKEYNTARFAPPHTLISLRLRGHPPMHA